MKRIFFGLIILPGLLSSGCPDGSTSRLDLTITFPDASARADTVMVRAMVIEPDETASCEALLSAASAPGDAGYRIEDQAAIVLPADESDAPLKVKGSGARLFYAEASDEAGDVFLRGCTAGEARPDGVTEVTIALVRAGAPCSSDADCDDGLYCTGDESCQNGFCSTAARDCDDGDLCTDDSCDEDADSCVNTAVTTPPGEEGPEGDASCSDGLDNDCDGDTDAADTDCAACVTDADCNDGLYCTGDETCEAGTCVTTPRDCDDQDFCTDDTCDEDADICTHDAVTSPPDSEGPEGDASCDDGLDNDCDGLTDGDDPQCLACTQDGECNDQNACTSDSCQDGGCINEAVGDGAPCDDGDACTDPDRCTSGLCTGWARDCSQLDDECLTGVCDAGLGDCVAQPKAPGTDCEDGDFCSAGDQCDDVGVCVGGGDSPCTTECLSVCDEDGDACTADAPDTPCSDDGTFCNGPEVCDGAGSCGPSGDPCGSAACATCDEDAESCTISAGLTCDDGVACTENDECDAAGACAGTPNDSLCGAGEVCSLACFGGCGLPPSAGTLSCDDPVSLTAGDQSQCTLSLSGGDNTGQAACLACSAEVGLSLLEDAVFDDGAGACDLRAWSLGSGCRDKADNCAPSGGPKACCEDAASLCDTTTFSRAVLRSDEALNCSTTDEEWRLSKAFDLSGVTSPRVCFDTADLGASPNSALILFAGPAANPLQDVIVCAENEYRAALDGVLHRLCGTLPAGYENNADVVLTFVAHSELPGEQIFLAGVQLSGWVLGCASDVLTPLDENFAACDLSGWTTAGSPNCLTGVGCANDTAWRPGVFSDTDDISLQTTVDAGDLDGAVEVCFQVGSEAYGASDALDLWVDAGAGPQTVWSVSGPLGTDGDCGTFCLDLAQIDPGVRNNPALVLGFDIPQTSSLGLYGVQVQGSRHCAAQASDVALSALVDDGGGQYSFTATDLAGVPLDTQLHCSWSPSSVEFPSYEVSYTP